MTGIGEWLANGRTLRRSGAFPGLTMTDLIARYRRFAGEHYQRDGRPTAEIAKIRDALVTTGRE